DSWRLSLSGTPAWSPVIIPVRPPTRSHHTAIVDRTANRLVVFGGADGNGQSASDVWALTLGTVPAWSQVVTSGTAPSGRKDVASIFDPVRNRMILFGGWNGFN